MGYLTIEEYEEAVRELDCNTYPAWYALFKRLRLTDLAEVKRAAIVKWDWIAALRNFPCAYCEYQKPLTVGTHMCETCPVKELCADRSNLTAGDIAKMLAT